jgi:8-oxo-dGTP pyrophosphatase MutT (NUDIX family)
MAVLSFNQYLNEGRAGGKNAAGVAIIYQNKILLVHPTGGSWQRGICGIPKGGMEPGEDPMEAAIRELFEETSIRVRPDQLEPSPYVVDILSKKHGNWQLIYFLCKIEDLAEISLESERIPKDQLQLEEVDWAKFVGPEEAYPLTSSRQLIILDRHLSLNK